MLKFGTQFCSKKILSFWKCQLCRWLLWPITCKNVFFTKKTISRRIINIYHQKKFEFGAKYEFLEPIKNLCIRKKLISQRSWSDFHKIWRGGRYITKTYHHQFFRIFGTKFEFSEQKNWHIRVMGFYFGNCMPQFSRRGGNKLL